MAGTPVTFSSTGSLFSERAEQIEEIINKSVDIILPSLDPIWRDTIVTSQGVGPSDALGRDMVILRLFQGGMTGVLEQGFPRDDFVLFGDNADPISQKLYQQSADQTFPNPLEGPNQAPYRLGIPMRSMVANIAFTMGELQAEALPAFIGSIIAPKLEGFARNISHTLCNYFYVSQNASYRLGNVSNIDGNGVGDTATVWLDSTLGYYTTTFEPSNQATDRFYVGQRVDIFSGVAAGGAGTYANLRNAISGVRQNVVVSAVDELNNIVTLATRSIPTGWDAIAPQLSGVLVDTDIIVYANSHSDSGPTASDNAAPPSYTGIAGINSWLKNGNVNTANGNDEFLLGAERIGGAALGDSIQPDAVSVNEHPEHKSFSLDLGGQVLTEHKLRQYLRRFHAAKNKYGYFIDCLLASEGVWLGYESTKIGRERIERAGRLSSLKMEGTDNDELGYGGFKMYFDGREYMGYESTYIDDGTMYGIRKGGQNWKRYVPPDPKGTRSFDRTEPFIPFKFVAGILTGLGTSQLPIYRDSAGDGTGVNLVTEASQMPGMLRMQLVPDQFCMMKLVGVGTDKVYSDDTVTLAAGEL